VRLANPLILSSMYSDTAILRRAMGLGWGAVTAKSITPGPAPGHPEPNLVRIQTAEGPGLVNCNGFKNPGLDAYRSALAALPHRVPLIVAAAGESAEDYVRVVAGLQEFGELVELNISSPNTKLVYGWSTRPAELKDVFRAVRAATAKPLIVKISPDLRETNEEITIPAALDAGITIVNYGNTRRVDEPRLSQRTGGPLGAALFATTLENVRRVRERFGDRLELIATGGIDSPDSARRALDAARPRAGSSPGSSPAARSCRAASSTRSRPPARNNPQVIHLSTAIHNREKGTLRRGPRGGPPKSDALIVHRREASRRRQHSRRLTRAGAPNYACVCGQTKP